MGMKFPHHCVGISFPHHNMGMKFPQNSLGMKFPQTFRGNCILFIILRPGEAYPLCFGVLHKLSKVTNFFKQFAASLTSGLGSLLLKKSHKNISFLSSAYVVNPE